MLVKTDYEDSIRKGRITLQCELRPSYYTYFNNQEVVDIRAVSQMLKELEHSINPDGATIMTLSTTMPVGYGDRFQPDWLVIEIAEASRKHEAVKDWENFLAQTAARIIKVLAAGNDARIATVEYDDKRFIVMNDIDPHDKSDYIEY